MDVDHRRFDMGVAKQRLNRADVIAVLEKMRRKGVAEDMACHPPRYACGRGGDRDRLLHGRLVDVPPPPPARHRVDAQVGRCEQVLPREALRGAGRLPLEGERQLDPALTGLDVRSVPNAACFDDRPKRLDEPLEQRRHSVLVALAASNRQLEAVEFDVHQPNRLRLADAQPAAIHEHGDQPERRWDLVHDQGDFATAEDRRKPSRGARAHRVEGTRIDLEHLLVEKHDRVHRLILRGGGDLPLDGEMRQTRLHLRRAHRTRMPPSVASSVKALEGHDPHPIRLFGTTREMPAAGDRNELLVKHGCHLARWYRSIGAIGAIPAAMTRSPRSRPAPVLRKRRTVTPRVLRKPKNRPLGTVLHQEIARPVRGWGR